MIHRHVRINSLDATSTLGWLQLIDELVSESATESVRATCCRSFELALDGYVGDEGFTTQWHHAVDCRGRSCPSGKRRKRKKIGGRSCASTRRYQVSFLRLFFLAPLAARSYHPRHASQSIRIGARIHFAPIAWRALAARSGAPSG
jgi:hypothetical protein